MDPKTGQIHPVVDDALGTPVPTEDESVLMTMEEARARGYVPIPPREMARVQAMNTQDRKRWARRLLAREKRLTTPAFNKHADKAERNALKRERRAR